MGQKYKHKNTPLKTAVAFNAAADFAVALVSPPEAITYSVCSILQTFRRQIGTLPTNRRENIIFESARLDSKAVDLILPPITMAHR